MIRKRHERQSRSKRLAELIAVTPAHRKVQFSLLSILLFTALIAVYLLAARWSWHVMQLASEIDSSHQKIRQLEQALSARQQNNQYEFFGFHRHPVLAIDPRIAGSRPALVPIFNREKSGPSGTFYWDSPGDTVSATRRVRVELRLLRSLDGVDYYRLVYRSSSVSDPMQTSEDGSGKTLLFQYDGKPRVLTISDELAIAIAPDQTSCFETMLSLYEPQDVETVRLAWLGALANP